MQLRYRIAHLIICSHIWKIINGIRIVLFIILVVYLKRWASMFATRVNRIIHCVIMRLVVLTISQININAMVECPCLLVHTHIMWILKWSIDSSRHFFIKIYQLLGSILLFSTLVKISMLLLECFHTYRLFYCPFYSWSGTRNLVYRSCLSSLSCARTHWSSCSLIVNESMIKFCMGL